ncbi:MAG: SpvB/TcaC N-terminal domain-containing protein [Cyanobacteria bacterium J06639_14]
MFEVPIQSHNQQATDTDTNQYSLAPTISLPKGGGAIKGIGEKFAANPVTGTGSMSVPIATSPGRAGFGPQLTLTYDSGAGNSAFGFGWHLSIPTITRKTAKGLPRYLDAEESDVFILSGAEDLVPVLNAEGAVKEWLRDGYRIRQYRPRIEGLFARIERWTDVNSGETHWRSFSQDNITTLYGRTAESRIADPDHPAHIFNWLICESYDDKGNAIRYSYKPEDSEGIDTTQAHEHHRTLERRAANRYLKRIQYGNRTPRQPQEDLGQRTDWLFQVVFDFGEHDLAAPTPDEGMSWSVRNDPFSTYRSGFEVRTYRLCQRVLMFHHFPNGLGGETGYDGLVRSTDFHYDDEVASTDARNPIYSRLLSVTQTGYEPNVEGGYRQKSLPPLAFTYSEPQIDATVRQVDPGSLANLPEGLDGTRYQWVDLDGEGLSGILTEQGEGWFYKRNLSPLNRIQTNGSEHLEARLGAVESVASKPAMALAGGQFFDLAGDGQLDLVALRTATPGFYERTPDEDWEPFTPFRSLPVQDWDNPNLKFIDLNGDGHSDLLITEEDCFVWHPSLAEDGFGAAVRSPQPWDEESGTRIVFADGTQSIYLADFSGDGLTDIVRIRNGEVCYWPNLGYGRFGAKVTMDQSPWFDAPDIFDQRRIQLADIDGSGTTDLLYLSDAGVQIYFNQSGNAWSSVYTMAAFPPIDSLATVATVDLLGNGTACLVWSSPLPGQATRALQYIDLMGGQKPHLLIKTVNHLGAETRVRYAPSTQFYLEDKWAGKPWMTKLPFPVQVVERVETYDRISRNRFVTRYAYHHGYFDGSEREFRGFGMVEQIDTEEFAALHQSEAFPVGDNIDEASHIAPVLTRSWFHTGADIDGLGVSRLFQADYYREPGLSDADFQQQLLPDTVLPEGLTLEEKREAHRALKGSRLRQEVYALDGTAQAPHPYAVTEQNFTLRRLQPRGNNRHGVFLTHAREALTYHYERNPVDPRISHALTLAVDDYGKVLQSATIGYGRRYPDPLLSAIDQDKQSQVLITCSENAYTNSVDEADHYRTPLPSETLNYELTGLVLAGDRGRFSFEDLQAAVSSAESLAYHQAPSTGIQKRVVEQARTVYRRNDLTGALPLGVLESLALPFERYQLAFTPEHLHQVFGDRLSEAMLTDEGRYVHLDDDNNWWIPSGQVLLSPGDADDAAQERAFAQQHFFLPQRFLDPFGQFSFVTYDAYDLLLLETQDALENRVTVGDRHDDGNIYPRINYRILQPELMTDPNGNRSAVVFDVLGRVAGTAMMSKTSESLGDSLEGFQASLTQAQIDTFFADPRGAIALELLGGATSRIIYDETRYQRLEQPSFAAIITRETHLSDLAEGEATALQISLAYSDGFGRTIQSQMQAEPGPVEPDGETVSPRWTTSGWTIFNNKGNPVKHYEPFFSADHGFEFGVTAGVSPTLFYDPVGRVVATLHPNRTWEKVIFNPWRQETWDVNDTVLVADPASDADVGNYFARLDEAAYLPTWHQARIDGTLGHPEQEAAQKAAAHADTPAMVHFDSLGRPCLSVADNGPDGQYETRTEQDIEGHPLRVIDARGNAVMVYQVSAAGNPPALGYDVAGRPFYENSMDAGERWVLSDIAGKPIRRWDSRGQMLRSTHDALQRPTHLFVQRAGEPEWLAMMTVYGESHPDAASLNLRGQVYQVYDGAGVVTSDSFDFKGNPLTSQRQLAQTYHTIMDWSVLATSTTTHDMTAAAAPLLEAAIFTTQTAYDALNRPVALTTPDSSVTRPTYSEANLLDQMAVHLQGATQATLFVTNIDYDARGQRDSITYATTDGANFTTTYTYDPETFRLTRLQTLRHQDGQTLQDLNYVYDPAGNMMSIRDEAQQTVFFNNAVVEPHNTYTYDALYRLIQATGREHATQITPQPDAMDFMPAIGIPFPNSPDALQRYLETYTYDSVGNILTMQHRGGAVLRWNRRYQYAADNNHLLATSRPGDAEDVFSAPYTYDVHGNIATMPHLPLMQWDFQDQLQSSSRQVVNAGTPETTYYIYDASGQRVRKVTERQASEGATPTRMKERIYLGGFEVYREYSGDGNTVTLERETLHVMDDQHRMALVETKTTEIVDGPEFPTSLNVPIIRYQLSNHLGSTSLELDANGEVIAYEEYHPYGTTAYQAGRSAAEVSLKRYRYTGMERDEETGLAYHAARYYAPWLGRWLNPDPIGIQGGLNLYQYALNRPSNLIDPDGLEPEEKVSKEGRLANQTVEDLELSEDQKINISKDLEQALLLIKNKVSDRFANELVDHYLDGNLEIGNTNGSFGETSGGSTTLDLAEITKKISVHGDFQDANQRQLFIATILVHEYVHVIQEGSVTPSKEAHAWAITQWFLNKSGGLDYLNDHISDVFAESGEFDTQTRAEYYANIAVLETLEAKTYYVEHPTSDGNLQYPSYSPTIKKLESQREIVNLQYSFILAKERKEEGFSNKKLENIVSEVESNILEISQASVREWGDVVSRQQVINYLKKLNGGRIIQKGLE